MSLPNLLSLLRITLMPFILLALRSGRDLPLLALMLAAVATDFFDGLVARKTNQISDLGKVLDPLADKVCVDTMVIALSLWRGFPWWATGIIVGRDLLILLGGLVLMKKAKTVPVSNWPGKVAVTSLAVAIVSYAMRWQPWGYYILLASMALVAISGAIYLNEFRKQRGAA